MLVVATGLVDIFRFCKYRYKMRNKSILFQPHCKQNYIELYTINLFYTLIKAIYGYKACKLLILLYLYINRLIMRYGK